MFEVSWCVGLYVTILLLEFLPVPLERWGLARAMAVWKRWSGAYVAGATSQEVALPLPTIHPVYAKGSAGIADLDLPATSPVVRRGLFGVSAAG